MNEFFVHEVNVGLWARVAASSAGVRSNVSPVGRLTRKGIASSLWHWWSILTNWSGTLNSCKFVYLLMLMLMELYV